MRLLCRTVEPDLSIGQRTAKIRCATKAALSRRGRIGFRGRRTFQLRQNVAQGPNQLVARNVALLELNPEPERLIFRLELKNKRLRPLRTGLLFPALAPCFVPRQTGLQGAMRQLPPL